MNPLHSHRPLRTAVAAALLAGTALAQTNYHEESLGFHLGRIVALKPSDYRMVSLDVAGNRLDQRWSAVWEQKAGPEWDAIHGASSGELSVWRDQKIAEGYRMAWITSAGADLNRVYGAIMVKDGRQARSYLDLLPVAFDTACQQAHADGLLLVSVSVHGPAGAPRYAAVFAENPGAVRWGLSTNDTVTDHQNKYPVFVGSTWARPAVVTMTDDRRYTAVYHDDQVGTVAARQDLTRLGYETEKATLAGQGYRPLQIMVSGQGTATRYAALFVKGTPAQLVRTTTGIAVPGLQQIDELMQGRQGPNGQEPGFLQQKSARNVAVAIAKDGNLVFARGYTWAPSGWPITQPITNFRLASCTKPLTAIAMFHLAAARSDVSLDSRLVDLVPLGTPLDPRVNDITVRHLINHRSGYDRYWGDGCTDKLAAAQDSFAAGMLEFVPGSTEKYSNGGYMMLGLAIEQKSGFGYFNYLQQRLFAPLGITRAHLIRNVPQITDARCQEAGWGGSRLLDVWRSPVHPGNPFVNGALAISDKAIDAMGGVDMSVVDYVRVLSGVFDHTVRAGVLSRTTRSELEAMIEQDGRTGGFDSGGLISRGGKTYRYYEKGGLWRSAHTYVVHRSDGISIAAFCAGPVAPPIREINALLDTVTTWPTHDLFPTYGLPAFVKGMDGALRPFGTACPGSNGAPAHTLLGQLEIGRTLSYRLASGPVSGATVLELGGSDRFWGTVPLPLELSAFGAPGCRVYVAQDTSLLLPTQADGSASFNLTVPFNTALIGTHLFSQFLSLDPPANAAGLTLSNAIDFLIGGWN